MDETFEPKEEGLNVVRRKRRVGAVTVTLCGDVSRIDAGAVGYQAPVPEDEVTPTKTKPKKKTNEQRGAKTDDDGRGEEEEGGTRSAEEAEEGETVRQEPARSGPEETSGDAARSFVGAGAMSGRVRSELVSSRRRRFSNLAYFERR